MPRPELCALAIFAGLPGCVSPQNSSGPDDGANPYAPLLCGVLYAVQAEKTDNRAAASAYQKLADAMIHIAARWNGKTPQDIRPAVNAVIEETHGNYDYWFGPNADPDAYDEGERVKRDCRGFACTRPETRGLIGPIPK